MSTDFFLGKVFLLITGASRGIGSQLAIVFSQLLSNNSDVLLLARNETGLRETADRINNSNVNVHYTSIDLSRAQADQLNEIINKYINSSEYDNAIVIYDAGSLGDVTELTDNMVDFDVWTRMYDLNVFSPAVLNSVFMRIFNGTKATKLVINLTSIAAITPLQYMGYYCSAKAAREMYFRVFAAEFPSVNVLNYSPFLVETTMLEQIEKEVKVGEAPIFIQEAEDQRKILTPMQAADRLVEIVREQKYKSGEHVDYYDKL